DSLASLVMLLERSVVNNALGSERGQSFYELALKAIEWHVRRNELWAARHLLRAHELMIDALVEKLFSALDARDDSCCRRTLVPSPDAPSSGTIVLSDHEWEQVPQMALRFSTPLSEFAYRFTDDEPWRPVRPVEDEVIIPLVRDVDIAASGTGRSTI